MHQPRIFIGTARAAAMRRRIGHSGAKRLMSGQADQWTIGCVGLHGRIGLES